MLPEVKQAADISAIKSRKDQAELIKLVEERDDVGRHIALLEERKDQLKDQISAILMSYGLDKVQVTDKLGVSYYESRGRSTIDKKLLLGKGVMPDIIAEATIPGRPYTVLKVWPVGGEEPEEE